ncbi:hypothetical protein [Sphingomonas sanxanigenens]|uniref:PepSY domain-containing protein n=1 Tax=Sphingomonas sanxanigenens DSM 19645 = NX02 TaxID=1123269 RepID=W0A911_9SPHN|nr:hypothetical protein [Sphingomonas sanxanigenens]AHE52833.1 hypothetical protein NX02_05470 [Sphingomonas sanxanigenens DSM 19645 = NX02]
MKALALITLPMVAVAGGCGVAPQPEPRNEAAERVIQNETAQTRPAQTKPDQRKVPAVPTISDSAAIARAKAALAHAGHKCTDVKSAEEVGNEVLAVCADGDTYRIFNFKGEEMALNCSAAKRIANVSCFNE